jgi:serine/threonine-protein kinase
MSAGSYLRWTLGSWRLVDFLGAGGMGEVYRAVHLRNGRIAAVKILTASSRTPSFLQRFRNEARILASLQHPRVAGWYETFDTDGLPCIAMEYVSGETVEQRLRHGPLAVAESIRVFSQVVEAVAYIHERGVVHRDIKSNNIKVDDHGQVKLLDFGIAKTGDSPKLTTEGAVVGTLHYLSPEQVRGESATPRSDVWALGVVMYEMVTGQVPFTGDSFTGVMARILKGSYEAPTVLAADLPRGIEKLIARCLRVDAKERFADAGALLAEVRAIYSPAPTWSPALPARWPLFASIGGACLTGAFLLWTVATIDWRGPSGTSLTPADDPRDSSVTVTPPTRDTQASKVALRPVVIKIFEGTADVVQQGRIVGRTPFVMQAPIGTWIEITLRQSGFDDLPKRFQVADGPNEFQYTMQRATNVPPFHAPYGGPQSRTPEPSS